MDSEPIDPSFLRLQQGHRSTRVWEGDDTDWLVCRRREAVLRRFGNDHIDDRVVPLLQASGFLGVARLRFIQLDWHLITALVER